MPNIIQTYAAIPLRVEKEVATAVMEVFNRTCRKPHCALTISQVRYRKPVQAAMQFLNSQLEDKLVRAVLIKLTDERKLVAMERIREKYEWPEQSYALPIERTASHTLEDD